jgi:hypothetical protein
VTDNPCDHEVPFTWKVLLTLAERDLRQASFSQARSTFQLINTALKHAHHEWSGLMGLSGLGYIVQGWVLGSEGFSGTDEFAILGGYVLIVAWIIWLVVVAWRTKESSKAPTA